MSIDGSLSGSSSSLENPLNIPALSSVYGTEGLKAPERGSHQLAPHPGTMEPRGWRSPNIPALWYRWVARGHQLVPHYAERCDFFQPGLEEHAKSMSVFILLREGEYWIPWLHICWWSKLMQGQLNLLFFLISFWGQENLWFFLK